MSTVIGRETADVAYFCPYCGSAAVQGADTSAFMLDSTPAASQCTACGWRGTTAELLNVPFKHGFADREETLEVFVQELRGILGRDFAVSMGRLLLKWGFLAQPVEGDQLSRYLSRIMAAVASAILDERTTEEKRRHGRPTRTPD